MRVRSMRLGVTLATVLLAGAGRAVWAAEAAPPAAKEPPTPRELTDEEKEFLRKLLLHTNAEPDSGPAPLTVRFSVEIFETDDPVNPKYVWDFGDGSPKVRQQSPTHTYKKPGEYRAVIKVTDEAGQAGQDDLQISVEVPEKK